MGKPKSMDIEANQSPKYLITYPTHPNTPVFVYINDQCECWLEFTYFGEKMGDGNEYPFDANYK